MAFTPGSSHLRLRSANLFDTAVRWMQGVFGHRDFSPEEALAESPNIDPLLLPRVPMNATNIDVGLQAQLSGMGMRRAKLISPETHPELMAEWQRLCTHAGMKKPPQLILAESKTVNALTVSPEEIVVTTGLFKILNLRELMAVLGHELGHETSDHKTPRVLTTVAFGTAGALGAHRLAAHAGYLRADKVSVLFAALDELMVLAAGGTIGSIVANQVSVRPTELDADKKGAIISRDPQGLISALLKLDASRGKHPVRNFFAYLQSGYPTISQRVARLKEMPMPLPAEPAYAQSQPHGTLLTHTMAPGVQVSEASPATRMEIAATQPAIG